MSAIGVCQATAEHMNYVKATLSHSLWEHLARIPKPTWDKARDTIVLRLLKGAGILIAHPTGDPATILGWMVHDGPIVLWVYVPFALRKRDIPQILKRYLDETVTNQNDSRRARAS